MYDNTNELFPDQFEKTLPTKVMKNRIRNAKNVEQKNEKMEINCHGNE